MNKNNKIQTQDDSYWLPAQKYREKGVGASYSNMVSSWRMDVRDSVNSESDSSGFLDREQGGPWCFSICSYRALFFSTSILIRFTRLVIVSFSTFSFSRTSSWNLFLLLFSYFRQNSDISSFCFRVYFKDSTFLGLITESLEIQSFEKSLRDVFRSQRLKELEDVWLKDEMVWWVWFTEWEETLFQSLESVIRIRQREDGLDILFY